MKKTKESFLPAHLSGTVVTEERGLRVEAIIATVHARVFVHNHFRYIRVFRPPWRRIATSCSHQSLRNKTIKAIYDYTAEVSF